MLDSGSSSNVMTRKVMEQRGLIILRPYQNVCAMDSREIDVVCIILNFLVKLAAYPDIGVTMDIVVINVPDRWRMFLSRKWDASLGGSIQMDWTYAMIPDFEDAHVKLYRENERSIMWKIQMSQIMNIFVKHIILETMPFMQITSYPSNKKQMMRSLMSYAK